MTYSEKYKGYDWIKIHGYQRHYLDLYDGWECNYHSLETHHIAETEFLIAEVRKLAELLDEKDRLLQQQMSGGADTPVPETNRETP